MTAPLPLLLLLLLLYFSFPLSTLVLPAVAAAALAVPLSILVLSQEVALKLHPASSRPPLGERRHESHRGGGELGVGGVGWTSWVSMGAGSGAPRVNWGRGEEQSCCRP